jgi:phosphoribosylformylglycinamidine synthase
MAMVLETPFISGKDSLNNEFSYMVDGQKRRSRTSPRRLLHSPRSAGRRSVARCVTMDLKQPGNLLISSGRDPRMNWAVRITLWSIGLEGGVVPKVDAAGAKRIFAAVHAAIAAGGLSAVATI